jgi:hypothetical protein
MDYNIKLMEQINKYAQSTGLLRGYIIATMLYDELTPSNFKRAYNALVGSYSIHDHQIEEFDMVRIVKRAHELGIDIPTDNIPTDLGQDIDRGTSVL